MAWGRSDERLQIDDLAVVPVVWSGCTTSNRSGSDLKRFRYSLSPVGWIGRDGLRHEWFYEFDVTWRVSDFGPRGLVKAAKSGLSVAPNERYSGFMSREVYPRDSVTDLVLRRDEVKAATKAYPFLKRVEVCYDAFWDKNPKATQRTQGFEVVIDLGDSLRNENRVSRLRFFVPSGLDGPADIDGRPVDPDHLPQDTLGEVRYLGAGWPGE